MNIFVLDKNPIKAARMLCNAHVIKMILESCQLLSTHDRLNSIGDTSDLYKPIFMNHPCRKCLDNPANYNWLCYHLAALLDEYTIRYKKTHKSTEMAKKHWLNGISVTDDIDNASFIDKTNFPKVMPEEFWVGTEKNDSIENVIASYKKYYVSKKEVMRSFKYPEGKEPEWLSKE